MIALAIPLILRKVKPNVWYGFRTRKTLSDEEVWYAANRYAGKTLLLAGCAIVIGAVVLYGVVRSAGEKAALDASALSLLWLAVLSVPLVTAVIASFVYLKRL